MTPNSREILERVAAGELSPEEAEQLLESSHERQEPSGATKQPLRKVKVAAGFGSILISGDPDVAEAQIEGHHSASLEGDTLVIHADVDPISPGLFSMHFHEERREHRSRHREAKRGRRRGGRGRFPSTLRVRVNPAIEIDAKLDAGPLYISRLEAPVRARSAAGPITIEDVTGPLDVAVNAGAIRIDAKLTTGESRVRSDAGAVRVDLHPDSSVRVVAQAALGKVVLPGTEEHRRGLGSMQETTIGGGDASLWVETAMGSINVTSRGSSSIPWKDSTSP